MDLIDSLGRRRRPGQNRGLRPLFPPLPHDVQSRVLRIAMARERWDRLDAMLPDAEAGGRPRQLGALLERMLDLVDLPSASEPDFETPYEPSSGADWQDWQIHKERSLLFREAGAL